MERHPDQRSRTSTGASPSQCDAVLAVEGDRCRAMSRWRGASDLQELSRIAQRMGISRPPARPGTPRNSRAVRPSAGRDGAARRRPCGARSRTPRRESGCSGSGAWPLEMDRQQGLLHCILNVRVPDPGARKSTPRHRPHRPTDVLKEASRYAPSSPAIAAVIIRDQGSSNGPLMGWGLIRASFRFVCRYRSGDIFCSKHELTRM